MTLAREQDVAAVMAHVTRDGLLDAVRGAVDIASPTGHEAPVATWIAQCLQGAGMAAQVPARRPVAGQCRRPAAR